MEHIVDARGKSCPQPLIETKKRLENISIDENIVAIVDNEAAKENIVRFAESSDCSYSVEEKKGEYFIRISREDSLAVGLKTKNQNIVLLSSDRLGKGEDILGNTLLKSFLYSISQLDTLPEKIILMNSGVKLGVEDSEFLQYLLDLEKQGIEIISCGTCLDYYGLKDKLCVGSTGNMYSIAEHLVAADKTITF